MNLPNEDEVTAGTARRSRLLSGKAESVASPSGLIKPGTTRDPLLTYEQEQRIREQAAKEAYWGPDELRNMARRWLHESNKAMTQNLHQLAHRYCLLAADLQAKALELEARAAVKEMAR
jgi:hypothetical protein